MLISNSSLYAPHVISEDETELYQIKDNRTHTRFFLFRTTMCSDMLEEEEEEEDEDDRCSDEETNSDNSFDDEGASDDDDKEENENE